LVGPITSVRLPGETKLVIVRAVVAACDLGASVSETCRILELPRDRYYRWVGGADPATLTAAALEDRPPVPLLVANRLTEEERQAMLAIATCEAHADQRHRKLAHLLGREQGVFVSPSSMLRLLGEHGLVERAGGRARKPRPGREELALDGPGQLWAWDLSYIPVGTPRRFWYLVAIIDCWSRKLVGHVLWPQATAAEVIATWDKALAAEGLLALEEAERPSLPASLSDRGTQMTSRSVRAFFNDLGIVAHHARPRHPNDNATMESWFATYKGERLWHTDYTSATPAEVAEDLDAFVDFYNHRRLHQGIGFVTPAERHDGRGEAIIAARRRGMAEARAQRLETNRRAHRQRPRGRCRPRGTRAGRGR
jgi:transposase InsO family protein